MNSFESKLAELKGKYDLAVAENKELRSSLTALKVATEKNDKEYTSHIAIERIENKQLSNLVSDLQSKVEEMKKDICIANRTVLEKSQIAENLRAVIAQKEDEATELSKELVSVRTENYRLDRLCLERDEYIEILTARLSDEAEVSSTLQKKLEQAALSSETTVASLEENILLLQNEIRLISGKTNKELEKSKLEKLNLTVRLQEEMEQCVELRKQCNDLHQRYSDLTSEKLSLLDSKNFLQEKLSRLTDEMRDRTSENDQTIAQVEKQQKEIQALRSENAELLKRINLTRNELKVSEIRYARLETAFADSIQKVMTQNASSI